MNIATRITEDDLTPAIESACSAIAPAWPLDRLIAVNPLWSHVSEPLEKVAARLGALSGERLVMDRQFFRQAWRQGQLTRADLEKAAAEQADAVDIDALVKALETDTSQEPTEPLPLLSDTASIYWQPAPGLGWSVHIRNHISRFCALYFDQAEADWLLDHDTGLYREWRAHFLALRGNASSAGHPALRGRAQQLPDDAGELIRQALRALEVPATDADDYLLALLLSIRGWASFCAWRRWEARLADSDDSSLMELLAIRLAWEWLLDERKRGPQSQHGRWQAACRAFAPRRDALAHEQRDLWLYQRALEVRYQQTLCRQLQGPLETPLTVPAVQAVFCIDVRSEVFRRNLESADPAMATHGFAGFFGLPLAWQPLGTDVKEPRLPGLLTPALHATQQGGDDQALAARRRQRLGGAARWKGFEYAPGSIFTLVESLGLFHAGKLIRRTLALGDDDAPTQAGLTRAEIRTLRPTLADATVEEAAALAASILRGMGLTDRFAPLVMLAGHGSQSANNPHAAGLDCGACGGQTGEVNARALADMLNKPAVREALSAEGIEIPEGTWFLAALHNTTTDEVTLFDQDSVPESRRADLDRLLSALSTAGDLARAERAPSLGLNKIAGRPAALKKTLRKRARDWGEVRPEWGLANNAAFIAAPRARTRGQDLQGRTFLHDYVWQEDPDFSTLTSIMTAPMVVAHWINMQYYASTVDNHHYGSGNKVLHNVVGGHLGVLEGNDGDLRIGLPWQSLHDGETLMHEPLRLSAFIEAPAEAIDRILEEQTRVRDLVNNDWLHLFRIDSDSLRVEQYVQEEWRPVGQ